MMHNAISAAKANHLYWLGRYTERVYICLHLLRRYYDKMIDGESSEYEAYSKKLNALNPYTDANSFMMGYMYDEKNPCSLLSGMIAANDNGIVLREEIMSETLSYIQLSLSHIRQSAEKEDANITDLQPITDYLLAFWGSIDERVFDERIRSILKIGKLVENIDIHVRFDYPFYRIEEAFECLKGCATADSGVFDKMILKHLEELIVKELYENPASDYKAKVLQSINHLVLL